MDRRTLLSLAAIVVLAALITQLNHYLALWQLHAWVGGLFVACVALRMDFRPGALAVFLGGLMLDARVPIPFGTHALLFFAAFMVVSNLRARLPREEPIVQVMVALFTNLGLLLALTFVRLGDSPSPADLWVRVFADVLVSQVCVVVCGAWFFAFQKRLTEIGGGSLRGLGRGAN